MMAARRLRLAVVVAAALALCCCGCLIHAATAAPSVHGLEELVQQDARVAPPASSCAATSTDDQDVAVVVAGEAEVAGGRERMDLELQDYPGSGANDRHSPWAQQRRN